jgi:hypothetical protein
VVDGHTVAVSLGQVAYFDHVVISLVTVPCSHRARLGLPPGLKVAMFLTGRFLASRHLRMP